MVKTASLDYAVLRFEVIGCGLLFLLLAFLHCIFYLYGCLGMVYFLDMRLQLGIYFVSLTAPRIGM